MNIADLRKSYEKAELSEDASAADPLKQFERWLNEASLQTSLRLLQPLANGLLHTYPIHPQIEDLRFNMPDVHEPFPLSTTEKQRWGID